MIEPYTVPSAIEGRAGIILERELVGCDRRRIVQKGIAKVNILLAEQESRHAVHGDSSTTAPRISPRSLSVGNIDLGVRAPL